MISSVKFKEGDRIQGDLLFGCNIYVYEDGPAKEYKGETEAILSTVSNAMKDTEWDPDNWRLFRSLFVDMGVDVSLDLSDKLKNSLPIVGDRL